MLRIERRVFVSVVESEREQTWGRWCECGEVLLVLG
jgi:hypothetical protein